MENQESTPKIEIEKKSDECENFFTRIQTQKQFSDFMESVLTEIFGNEITESMKKMQYNIRFVKTSLGFRDLFINIAHENPIEETKSLMYKIDDSIHGDLEIMDRWQEATFTLPRVSDDSRIFFNRIGIPQASVCHTIIVDSPRKIAKLKRKGLIEKNLKREGIRVDICGEEAYKEAINILYAPKKKVGRRKR